jgi:hypothetical protein
MLIRTAPPRVVDVVQSVRTGPVEGTGRGVAVVGVTSRVVCDGLLAIAWSFAKRRYP